MSQTNEQILRQYIACLNQKDLAGCMACFSEDASVLVKDQVHKGVAAIEAWHTERFGANFNAVDPKNYKQNSGEDSIDFQFTSDRLAGRRMEKLPASFLVTIAGERITKLQIKIRLGAGILKMLGF